MSRIDRIIDHENQQGFDSHQTRVCEYCIDEEELQRYVQQKGTLGHTCSYCKIDGGADKTLPFDTFASYVLQGIRSQWREAVDELGYDSGSGGYLGETFEMWDILCHEANLGFRSDQLRSDLVDAIHGDCWCRKDYYSLSPNEVLLAGWERFSDAVKHDCRYVFLQRRENDSPSEDLRPSEFLHALGDVISKLDLYKALIAGTKLYRLRVDPTGKTHSTAGALGVPPQGTHTQANRMSAAGIPALYAALDASTAISETTSSPQKRKNRREDRRHKRKESWSLGCFELRKDLLLVDFTQLPFEKSIFDPSSINERFAIRFIREFLNDFTAQIKREDREHIEYVPTQVVAEYLRFVHCTKEERPLDGILYPSAQKSGGIACVLFLKPKDTSGPDDQTIVALVSSEVIRQHGRTVNTKYPGRRHRRNLRPLR